MVQVVMGDFDENTARSEISALQFADSVFQVDASVFLVLQEAVGYIVDRLSVVAPEYSLFVLEATEAADFLNSFFVALRAAVLSIQGMMHLFLFVEQAPDSMVNSMPATVLVALDAIEMDSAIAE